MKTDNVIQPVIIGRGMAGQAIAKCLAIIPFAASNITILPFIYASRGLPLRNYLANETQNILFIANPSGLHAQAIIEASQSGYNAIICDKPVCVNSQELNELKNIQIPVTVLNGYRSMWGPQNLYKIIKAGELGEIFSIEIRYWQSSIAQRILSGAPANKLWKNDPKLNGEFDVAVDLGCHAIDMVLYLMGEKPEKSFGWLSYVNCANIHQDSHANISLFFSNARHASVSLSKICHGATNNFEIIIFGTKGTATWRFQNPDEIVIATGNKTSTLQRMEAYEATGSAPFHGLGWLEGYAEIIFQSIKAHLGLKAVLVPTLNEALITMDSILGMERFHNK